MTKKEKVRTGQISGIDLPVPRIFFGTANPPISTGEDAAFDLLDQVLALGINAFDCARSYGQAEDTLGRWMEKRGCRDRVTVLSKCGDVIQGKVLINKSVIAEQLAKSLEALRTDHIDILLLHRDDPNAPLGEIMEALNEHQEKGEIRVFGISNWRHQRIAEANRFAADHGLNGFSVSSPNYGLTRQMEDLWGGDCITVSGPENKEARQWYTDNQMPVIAYSSLGRGFFSGRFKSYDYDTARKVLDEYAIKGYLYEENMQRLRRAEELAAQYDTVVSDIAMRYIFGSSMNLYAVVSSSSPERMRLNIQAAGHPLSKEEVRFLEDGEE